MTALFNYSTLSEGVHRVLTLAFTLVGDTLRFCPWGRRVNRHDVYRAHGKHFIGLTDCGARFVQRVHDDCYEYSARVTHARKHSDGVKVFTRVLE